MVDVFISYSRDNKARVADIAAAVAAAGYDVWWDAELPPHRSYGDVITEKIGSAKAAIVVWSHASAQSEWVRAEADVARNQKKLVQTAIDDVMPPLPFNQIQFADLRDWNGDPAHGAWRKVLMSLEELCGRATSPVPATEPARVSSTPPPPQPDRQTVNPVRKSSFLPWAFLGLAIVAVALLAWKLLQPGPATPDTPTAAVPASENEAAAAASGNPAEAFTLAAVIEDPDGFTNIRSGASTKAAIVGKVLDGETFLTYKQPGQWWPVRKADGTTGWRSATLSPALLLRPALPRRGDAGALPAAAGGHSRFIRSRADRRRAGQLQRAGIARGAKRNLRAAWLAVQGSGAARPFFAVQLVSADR